MMKTIVGSISRPVGMMKMIVGSISRAVSMPPTIVAPNYKHPFVDGRV